MNKILLPMAEGFRDSVRLWAQIVVALVVPVACVVKAFVSHSDFRVERFGASRATRPD